MLHWLLPPSPPAINAGVQLSLWKASSLGDTLKCTRTHGHMENINIITKSKEQVRTAATQPWVIQSEHPQHTPPQGDWIRGLRGTAMLLGPADNWVINGKPLASESESTGLQAKDPAGLAKLLSHLDNGELARCGPAQAAEVCAGLSVAILTPQKGRRLDETTSPYLLLYICY